MSSDRQLPHNAEAERTVLGSILVTPSALDTARELLRREDFHLGAHRTLWDAYCACQDAGELVDMVTLLARLRSERTLERIGGAKFISALMDGLPRITNLRDWCGILVDHARRREAIHQGERLMVEAWDESRQIASTLDSHQSAMMRLLDVRGGSADVTMAEALKLAEERLNRYASARGGVTGIPSGLATLDDLTSGWQPGQVIIVAARTRCGKSSLCSQFSKIAATAGYAGRVFPLEMSPAATAERMLLSHAGVSRYQLRNASAWDRLTRSWSDIESLPITFDRRSSPTVSEIAASCRRQKRSSSLRFVIVDHLQRVSYDAQLEERIGVGRSVRALKSLALDLEVAVICACQFNRQAEGQEPTLADLAKSGDIENEADIVLALHPEPGVPQDSTFLPTRLLMLKHREGATRRIDLSFERELTRFVEAVAPTEQPVTQASLPEIPR